MRGQKDGAARSSSSPARPLSERSYPTHIAHAQATALHTAIQKTRVQSPRTDCIVPIGEAQLLEGLRKELPADFYTVATRPAGEPTAATLSRWRSPSPLAVLAKPEIEVDASGHMRMKRRAGRGRRRTADRAEGRARSPSAFREPRAAALSAVQLRHHKSGHPDQLAGLWPASAERARCRSRRWRSWSMSRRSGFPTPPKSKEAIEPYPEILKEIKLGLQQCARQLAHYLRHERAPAPGI